jgi:TPR repeat protein
MGAAMSEIQVPFTPAQTALIDQATAMARALGNGAKRIVLETDITGGPAILRENELQNAPLAVLEKLNIQIRPAPVANTRILSADLLTQARAGTLQSNDDRLAAGRALLTGIGAPRNIALGVQVLTPLIDAGAAEPARLAADALLQSDPDRAYQFALTAAAAGDGSAIGLLDRAEDTLDFARVMKAQAARLSDDALAPTRFSSIPDMRRAALDHMIGLGTPRSYRAGYFWASMAAAGGDAAAASLREDLSDRMRKRGLTAEWRAITDVLDEDILDGWVSANIPAIASQN